MLLKKKEIVNYKDYMVSINAYHIVYFYNDEPKPE